MNLPHMLSVTLSHADAKAELMELPIPLIRSEIQSKIMHSSFAKELGTTSKGCTRVKF
mgnify:FL=1